MQTCIRAVLAVLSIALLWPLGSSAAAMPLAHAASAPSGYQSFLAGLTNDRQHFVSLSVRTSAQQVDLHIDVSSTPGTLHARPYSSAYAFHLPATDFQHHADVLI